MGRKLVRVVTPQSRWSRMGPVMNLDLSMIGKMFSHVARQSSAKAATLRAFFDEKNEKMVRLTIDGQEVSISRAEFERDWELLPNQ